MRVGFARSTWRPLLILALHTSCDDDSAPRFAGPGALANTSAPSAARDQEDEACVEARYVRDAGAEGGATFEGAVYARMTGAWGCSIPTCHGPGATPPVIVADDAGAAYATLAAFGKLGKPYLNPCSTDPKASTIVCNMAPGAGTDLCGKPMPLGITLTEDDRSFLKAWVATGAPLR